MAFQVRIEPLGSSHDRDRFSSGSEELDRYLRTQAGQESRRHVAAVFVACPVDSNEIVGYYTLSAFSIKLHDLDPKIGKKLPRYPLLPATLLGRLAIAKAHQGKGLGKALLYDALERAWLNSREVASVAVVVDAKDAAAVAFYERYEFIRFAESPYRLYLMMQTIGTLVGRG